MQPYGQFKKQMIHSTHSPPYFCWKSCLSWSIKFWWIFRLKNERFLPYFCQSWTLVQKQDFLSSLNISSEARLCTYFSDDITWWEVAWLDPPKLSVSFSHAQTQMWLNISKDFRRLDFELQVCKVKISQNMVPRLIMRFHILGSSKLLKVDDTPNGRSPRIQCVQFKK